MTDVLTFEVEAGVSGQFKHRGSTIRFGEGYEQEVGDGMNSLEDAWPVSAAGPLLEMQPFVDFLEAHPPWISFWWAPPHRAQALYKCRAFRVVNKHGSELSVSATFERSFEP